MNPLHVLGLCEPRDGGVIKPRRDTLQFLGTVKLTDHPRKTIVNVGPESAYGATLGIPTPASSIIDLGGGKKQYVYDELGGQWFGIGPAFPGSSAFYITTALAAGDTISVQGFAPDPITPRKNLVNLGPDTITIEGRGGAASPGMVRGGAVKLTANSSARMFWDHIDESWRLIQAPDWRNATFNNIVIEGDRLVIKGWPVVLTPTPYVPPLANQITVSGKPVVYLGEPVTVTPGA